ncbi:hypothetical protein ACF0H5_003516 [Mactra antiquata]
MNRPQVGRPKSVSDSDRKLNIKLNYESRKERRIDIGDSIDDWKKLRTEIGCDDETLVKLLLKCYSRYGRHMGCEDTNLKLECEDTDLNIECEETNQKSDCEAVNVKCEILNTNSDNAYPDEHSPSSTEAPIDEEKIIIKTETSWETNEMEPERISRDAATCTSEFDSGDEYGSENFSENETNGSSESMFENDDEYDNISRMAEQKVDMVAVPCTNSETGDKRFSTRLRSKGVRPNYVSLAKWDSDDSDLEVSGEKINQNEDDMALNCSNEDIEDEGSQTALNQNNSKVKKGKRKLDEDPDFDLNKFDCKTETKSESETDEDDLNKEKVYVKKKAKKKVPWRSIKLEDYSEKYRIESVSSFERKNRGSNIVEELYSCLHCGKFKSIDRATFEKHIESHVNGVLECKQCDFIGASERELMSHRLSHGHETKKRKKLVCDLCGVVLLSRTSWQVHMGKEHDNPQFGCPYCEVKLATYSGRQLHVRTVHEDLTQYCNICKTNFQSSTIEEFEIHKSTCKPGHPCPICGKMLSSKGSLSQHIKATHMNVRKYQCDLCPYAAKCAGRLREHVFTHTGIHPYSCDQCSFTCVQAYQLTSHQRTHTGDKPYKCTQCNFAAAWNVQLKDHVKVHFMNTAVLCEPCNILFKNDKAKKIHERKDH